AVLRVGTAGLGRDRARWACTGCGAGASLTADESGKAACRGSGRAGAPTGGGPLEVFGRTLDLLRTDQIPGLPPLTSGMVGYLGYDTVRRLERISPDTEDDLQVPELVQLLATDLAADRKSTRLNSSHVSISYAVFCLKHK